MELTLLTMRGQFVMEFKRSSHIKDLQQQQDILSIQKKVGAPLGIAPANKSESHRQDLVGKQYGSVKIYSPQVFWLGARHRRFIHVLCECMTCGYRNLISLSNLQSGKTKGCRACNQPEPIYPMWLYNRVQAMRARCLSPACNQYMAYGGRGIEFRFAGVKQGTLWIMENLGLPEFSSVVERSRMQLDRINPNGHYEPGNLRWLSVELNQQNKRGNQSVARMHKFRMDYPEILYSDATLKGFFWAGMTAEQIIERYHRPSIKPKGKYGTYSIADKTIASLVRDY
jgi:hypothetical protein